MATFTLVLTACQAAQTATPSNFQGPPSGTMPANFTPGQGAPNGTMAANFQGPPSGTMPANVTPGQGRPGGAAAATATLTATATPRPTATATATAAPVTATAENAARAYFAALEKKDFSAASRLISIYSLSFINLTRSQAAEQLSAAGTTWSNFTIVGSQVFNDSTILVHVTCQTGMSATPTATPQTGAATATTSTMKDELWPFRLENGAWLYGWNNLIDYKTVDVAAQTNEHITVKPTQMVRYTDRLELHIMMQNQTSDLVYFVQPYDSLAVFHFGNQEVEADKSKQIALSGLRTSFDETILVKGLYTSYPNSVEIKKYKGYSPNPWYTFQF